jgi:hypothetical protein
MADRLTEARATVGSDKALVVRVPIWAWLAPIAAIGTALLLGLVLVMGLFFHGAWWGLLPTVR